MIAVKKLNKSYGDLHVIKDLDLHINKSEIVSIVGKSGSGKSTLLYLLGTLDKADSGSITIDNQNINELNKNELAHFRNSKIGFVFQFHHLLNEFTALENAAIPALIAGKSEKEAYHEAEKLLNYLGLADRINHKPNQLSGGEQQRVSVARALINNPSVVFADEPTGNLDSDTSEDLHSLFLSLRKDFDQTFIIVTHNEELALLSDRKLTLIDGKLS